MYYCILGSAAVRDCGPYCPKFGWGPPGKDFIMNGPELNMVSTSAPALMCPATIMIVNGVEISHGLCGVKRAELASRRVISRSSEKFNSEILAVATLSSAAGGPHLNLGH